MANPVFNLRFNITTQEASTFPGADYKLTGFVFDESANFDGTDAAVSDHVFDFNGNRYRILNFVTQTSTQLSVDVEDYRSDGIPSTGNGVICRTTTNFGFAIPSRSSNNISEYLKEYIRDQSVQEIDEKIYKTNTFIDKLTVSNTDITNGYIVLSNVPVTNKQITVQVIGGPLQTYSTDFTISGNQLTWVGDFASTVLVGDVLLVTYFVE